MIILYHFKKLIDLLLSIFSQIHWIGDRNQSEGKEISFIWNEIERIQTTVRFRISDPVIQ